MHLDALFASFFDDTELIAGAILSSSALAAMVLEVALENDSILAMLDGIDEVDEMDDVGLEVLGLVD